MTLVNPERLWSREEALALPSPVPKVSGVYTWFFRDIPPGVPTKGCVKWRGHTLLYVGIAPRRPASRQTLFARIRNHYQGNAEGSTLRLTLGCLLSEKLGIELRRVGSGKRMTFGMKGEDALSEWMGKNAFVTWVETAKPWELEEQLIRRLSLPLNLEKNEGHPFYPALAAKRKAAKDHARQVPAVGRSVHE